MTDKTIALILIVLLVVIVFLIGLIYFLLTAHQITGKETVMVGYIGALTGDGSQYGEWSSNGLKAAAEEINQRGGINNKKIEAVFEDHRGNPQDAVNSYHRLMFDNIKIILIGWSSPTLAVAPLANQNKVILVSYSATTPLYSSKNDYTFRTGINANQFAKEEAEFIFNELSKTKVAIIYINNDFGLGMRNVFSETFQNLGGKIAFEDNFEQNTKDFRSLITKAGNSDHEVIFLVGHLTENGLLVKQMHELGFNKQIVTDVYSVEGSDFIEETDNASSGIIYAAPFFNEGSKPEFISMYRKMFNDEPNYYAAQAYDALMVVAKAMESCGEDTDCIKDELFKTDGFQGASGILTFDEYGDVIKPIQFKTIKNSQFVPYEK